MFDDSLQRGLEDGPALRDFAQLSRFLPKDVRACFEEYAVSPCSR